MQNWHSQSNSTPSEPDYRVSAGTNTGEPWERFSVDQSNKSGRNGSGTKHLVFIAGHPSTYWTRSLVLNQSTVPMLQPPLHLSSLTSFIFVQMPIFSTPPVCFLQNPLLRHQMETFSASLALCGKSPPKGQWGGALMFTLICAWINVWVNSREAGDFRRHCAHYDIIIMYLRERYIYCSSSFPFNVIVRSHNKATFPVLVPICVSYIMLQWAPRQEWITECYFDPK